MSKMNFEKFKQGFTKIEYIEDSKAFGHHPFQLIAINESGEMEINALVGLRMENIISRVKEYLSANTRDIFLTLDLPKSGDVENDFVLALHLQDGKLTSSSTIEYNPDDGEIIRTLDNRDLKLIATFLSFLFLD